MKMMSVKKIRANRTKGIALLDALLGIAVFSVGILGLVAAQGVSLKNAGEARHRAEAAFLANQVIAQMWQDDKTKLAANYASPDGPKFLPWKAEVQDPGSGLPNATGANEPTIAIAAGNRVRVTVRWRLPGHGAHRYDTEAQICDNGGCP